MDKCILQYRENVKRILFRDYIYESDTMIAIVQNLFTKLSFEWYMKEGYTEEAAANTIFTTQIQNIVDVENDSGGY